MKKYNIPDAEEQNIASESEELYVASSNYCSKKWLANLDRGISYSELDNKRDEKRKLRVKKMLSLYNEDIDVCEYFPYRNGIGYNELRFLFLDSESIPSFESNNVHEWEKGEDVYKVFSWEEISPYEKAEVEDILTMITEQEYGSQFTHIAILNYN